MSTRERWIVYPLLFLALGAALRDKLVEKIEISRLKCNRLEVDGVARCGSRIGRAGRITDPTAGRPLWSAPIRRRAAAGSSRHGRPTACRWCSSQPLGSVTLSPGKCWCLPRGERASPCRW